MELTFLGTASSLPQASRNQQSLALHLAGETWLFDCGEATQRQLLRTAMSPIGVCCGRTSIASGVCAR